MTLAVLVPSAMVEQRVLNIAGAPGEIKSLV
jgi:hypothetical protein